MNIKALITIGLSILCLYTNGQELYFDKKDICKPNRAILLLNNKLDSIKPLKDTTIYFFTWVDNCAYRPKFTIGKVDRDTIMIKMENSEKEPAFCDCEYKIKLSVPLLMKYRKILKINNSVIKHDLNRYNAEVIRELGTYQKIQREIYYENGHLIVECFYNSFERLIKEKYYDHGKLMGEIDY